MRNVLPILLLLVAACASRPGFEGSPMPAAPAPDPGAMEEPATEEPAPDEPAEPEEEGGPLVLDIPGAVALAVERNPDLGVAAARIMAAEQGVEEARSGFYPSLDLGLGFVYSNDPVVVFMQKLWQRDLSFDTNFNNPGSSGNFQLAARVSWLLWDGGRRDADTELARSAARIEEDAREAILNALKASVIRTALGVYESDEFILVAEESVKLVSEQLRIARSRLEVGAAQRSDVLSVEVRLAEARETLVRARNGRERALTALRNLLGLEHDQPFELAHAPEFRVPPVEEAALVPLALANRPELKKAHSAVQAAERGVEREKAGRMPSVSAFGAYEMNSKNLEFGFDKDQYKVGLSLDYNAFDGHRTRARIAAAEARVRQAREMERKTALMVEEDLTRARLNLGEAEERVSVRGKSEEAAEEALSLIRARYETGAATITEYLDSEVALTRARVRNVAARFDVERATADLRRAVGICRAAPEKGENR